ncbi:hypothetical protein [Prosthecobacter sp.]|uniref:hypothetical protein n=1 Tax=Prosthecobacter sp. TaxID=1965333 RepID=UPI0037843AAA
MNVSSASGEDHPIQQLSFVALTNDPQMFKLKLERALQHLAQSRRWIISPPVLFGSDPVGNKPPVDGDAATDDFNESNQLAGYLDLYSAIQGPPLPYELDKAQFEEVTALVHMLERFSIEHGVEIEFYLDSEIIGKIVWGLQDESLRVGLLEEWSHMLDLKK